MDTCVLGILIHEDTYGYILTQKMKDVIDISDSTLYPVLRRLQKSGYLMTYDQPYQGRNRRYYKITEQGKKQYQFWKEEWNQYKEKIDILLEGGNHD